MLHFEDPDRDIRVEPGETFTIALRGNPTTGYQWHVEFSANYLDLVSRQFELESEAVGAGGRELFQFHARRRGKTTITFEYRRPWGADVRQGHRFQVYIG